MDIWELLDEYTGDYEPTWSDIRTVVENMQARQNEVNRQTVASFEVTRDALTNLQKSVDSLREWCAQLTLRIEELETIDWSEDRAQ